MALEPGRVRAICFDVDGTLRDTDDQWVAGWARRFRPFRRLLPGRNERLFARRLVMRLEGPGTFLNALSDSLGIDPWLSRWLDRAPEPDDLSRMLLIPGTVEMLARLGELYPLAVVSARGQRTTLGFLDAFALTPAFRVIATGLTCEHTKPHPDPILWAAQQMGVAAQECLMVGDTTVDIRAGRAAGAQTVGVLCGFGERDELRRAGADAILGATPELADLL